jgi:CRISPR-associated protein (TIGR03986 family)
MSFHNPYHFVPVKAVSKDGIKKNPNTKKFDFSSHPNVTHDRYAKGSYSGRVMCQITAKTAFVVGDKHDDTVEPTVVKQYELDRFPAIPATSIRGLISSIVETTSNSSLRVLENETYSYRKKSEEALQDIGMIVKQDEKNYRLLPLCYFEFNPKQRVMESVDCLKVELRNPDDYETFSIENQKFYYLKSNNLDKTTEQPISKDNYEKLPFLERKQYKRGFLRVMKNSLRHEDFKDLDRKHEIFVFWSEDDGQIEKAEASRRILPKAIERFHLLADLRTNEDPKYPFEPIGTKRNKGADGNRMRLETGDLVYYKEFTQNKEKLVTEISFSAIWRDLVGQEDAVTKIKEADTTYDFFRNIDNELLPFNKERKQITFAEQMFGLVENNGDEKTEDEKLSLAGRIYPSAAKFVGIQNSDGSIREVKNVSECYENNPTNDDGLTILKILDSPKTPSPALYFKPNYIPKNKLNAKTNEPQGRKFYLHDNSNQGRPWETKKPNENLTQKMKVKPVKASSVFNFYVDFENLSSLELGALLYSLHPNKEFHHKIGLGRPIGLGTVKIEILDLSKIDRYKRYNNSGLFDDRCQKINSDIEKLQSDFRSLNSNICGVLETLGNPDNLDANVHYPKVFRKTVEEENFKWFVANDSGLGSTRKRNKIDAKKEFLKPIVQNEKLPTLSEHPFND